MNFITKFYRGAIVESIHIGYAVAVDEDGKVIFSAGKPEYPVFIRSAAKPFQALPLLDSEVTDQYKLTDEELAVICASHNGEAIHTEVVSGILKKIGLKIENLKCGIHRPIDKSSYEQMIIKGSRPTALHNSCSGKHAGMLLLAKALDVSTDDYLSPKHLVQEKILEKILHYSGLKKILRETDDCGAPTYFMPLQNLAIMYRKLIDGSDENLNKIFHSMVLHPDIIAGKSRFDTDFISAMKGKAISKVGSNGVRAIGMKNSDGKSFGIAIKVLSDNKDVSASVAMKIMSHLKLIDKKAEKKLSKYSTPDFLTYTGEKIGKMETELLVEE